MTKIYASQISNLSDARYFASMEVDFIGIQLNEPSDLIRAQEMMSWVEGPMMIAEPSLTLALNPEISFENFDFVLLPPEMDYMQLPEHRIIRQFPINEYAFSSEYLFILSSAQSFESLTLHDYDIIQQLLRTSSNAILSMPFDVNNTADLIANLQPGCLLIKGGEEEKTGFKSFDELDILFEQLGRI